MATVLEELRITGLGVIESATLELGPGLTVITGETGAGKTMVVTALGLLLGGRADSGAVRSGSRGARVEGSLRVADLPQVVAAVDAAGGEVEGDSVLLARNVSAEGRSRAFVGGASVPVSQLSDVAEPLVAMHGQSDQHRLLQPRAQREALDAYGGEATAEPLSEYRRLYADLRETERELDEVVASARERAREADLLRFGVGEIEAVAPQPGEDTALAQEERRLGYADTLRTAAESAREALSSDEGNPDALAAVAAARTLLDGVREQDAAAGELADRVAEITYLLSDVAADVASYADALETDPARLAAVSERRAALTALTRKYGDTAADVLAWAESSASRLAELDDTDDRIARLRRRRDDLRDRLGPAAGALSRARVEAAVRLSTELTGELASLAMPHAVLDVQVRQTAGDEGLVVGDRRLRFGSSGVDEVE
ncbi:MAG TPA: AAA family ATPase, partial [Nocardioides sp.]|nr:AAA family ATPase [Nocardioides sp.]